MKNHFKYLMFLATVFTFSIGMVSCGNDDDDPTPAKTEEQEKNDAIKSLVGAYLDNVVYPTYTNLANESEVLYTLINNLKNKLKEGNTVSQSEIDAICDAYKEARAYWEESEAFLFGAASDFNIDPHMDTWPLDLPTLAKDLKDDAKIAALDSENGIEWARSQGNLTPENLGFHGIEFIFFRDGKNRSSNFFNNNDVEDDSSFSGLDVTSLDEVKFAAAIAGDLRDKCYQLEVCWLGSKAAASHVSRVAECANHNAEDFATKVEKSGMSYGENMLAAGTSVSTFSNWRQVMEEILVGGCSNICAEVADQKMGQAYRAATGKAEYHEDEESGEMVLDDPNYIESPYSYNSFTDFKGNILSIQYSLYGKARSNQVSSTSIMAYLKKYGPEIAEELDKRLQKALDAIDVCLNSGKAFVQDPGAQVVGDAMDAIAELDSYLNTTSNWVLTK